MGIQLPHGATPAIDYSCAFCGATIPALQPDAHRGYCDSTCKAAAEELDRVGRPARQASPLEAQITDADVNEAASRELLEGTELEDMLPERIRRALYEAGFNVETESVDEVAGEFGLRVRAADGQSCTMRITWEG